MGVDGEIYIIINVIKNSDIFIVIYMFVLDIVFFLIMVKNNGIVDEMNIFYKLLNERLNEFYLGYFLKFIFVVNVLLNV